MMNYNYQQPSNPLEEFRRFFSKGSVLSVLILINVAIWILIQAFKVILFFYNNPDSSVANAVVMHLLALPASTPLLLDAPWTLLTYMFLHLDIWHLLFNMIWLYWFGRIFLEFLPARQLVVVYLLGGLAGGLVYVVSFNIFPVFSGVLPVSYALGASASVMAIVTSISFFVPGYTIQLFLIGRMKILYLAIILFIFDFFMIPSGNAGGHLAHIGGALLGLVASQVLRFSKNSRQTGGSSEFFSNLKDRFQSGHRSQPPPPNYGRPVSDEEYNLKKRENQRRTDEILDKISKGGYDSLTKEEKEFLFKSSGKR